MLTHTGNQKKIKIFLSYSRADESHAEHLYGSLCEGGFDVWFDKEALLPGQLWEDEIKKEIAASDFVILMLSKISVGRRGFFQKELRLALDVLDTIPLGHVYLLPVRVDDCEIPGRLAAIHCVDLFPTWNRSLTKLRKAIELQTGVQSRAREIEADGKRSEEIRLLLVNDQPATMNFATDLWKGCGISVDYAFDVPQALRAIEKSSYSVVVSDLSHFSPSGIVTDRAAFEILEWARDAGNEIKLIISTGDLTEERVQRAHDLGAVGICSTLQELNDLLTEATGERIDYPPEFVAVDTLQKAPITDSGAPEEQAAGERCLAFVNCAHADQVFVEQLIGDLRKSGIECWVDDFIPAGETWYSPKTRMIREADVMLAIVSCHSVESSWFEREVYEGIAKERDDKSAFVIPLVIDHDAVKKMPYFLRSRVYVDFRGEYDIALKALVETIRHECTEGDG